MTFLEYIRKYHPNKRLKVNAKDASWNDEIFYYDEIVSDDISGEEFKIVYVDEEHSSYVKLEDIFDIPREEFLVLYGDPKAIELRDNYINNYSILYGEEVILAIQAESRKKQEELRKFETLDLNMLGL